MSDTDIAGKDFCVGSSSSSVESLIDFYTFIKNNHTTLPWKELENRGVITAGRKASSFSPLLPYMQTNKAGLFRRNSTSDDISTSLWLSSVAKKAQEKLFTLNEHVEFERELLTKDYLRELCTNTNSLDTILSMQYNLLNVGVVLVYVSPLQRSKVDGVVGLLNNGIPYIGMSLRYSRLDYYWFTLLHELSHIVLHYDLLHTPIIDIFDEVDSDRVEVEANNLALESLIPRHLWNRAVIKRTRSSKVSELMDFSRQINTHPAIVAGRLQKERNDYSQFRKIIDEHNIRELLGVKE